MRYIYKGNDRATISLHTDDVCVDEISCYEDGRYLSSSEAFWRIFEFPVHGRWPAVEPLNIHLKNQQTVNQHLGQTIEDALSKSEITRLTEYFKENAKLKPRKRIP